MNLKVNLRADGSPSGTTVKVGGSDLHGVRSARFSHDAGDFPRLEIELFGAEIEVDGRACFYVKDPVEGGLRQVAKIIFVDGAEWVAA